MRAIEDRLIRMTAKMQAERFISYQRSLAPLIQRKVDVFNVSLPTLTLLPDGTMRFEYHFTAEQQEYLAQIDEAMLLVAESYSFPNLQPMRPGL